jgi:hypothetical protein
MPGVAFGRAGGARAAPAAAARSSRRRGGRRDRSLVPLASPATGEERPDALAVMRAEDGETSWPEPPGPPVVLEPLIRPLPPPPDWRAEEAELARQRAAEVQERLEPARDPYRARPAREKPARYPA